MQSCDGSASGTISLYCSAIVEVISKLFAAVAGNMSYIIDSTELVSSSQLVLKCNYLQTKVSGPVLNPSTLASYIV